MDASLRNSQLGDYYIGGTRGHGTFKMSSKEARNLLKRITNNPGLADQFTEEEIEKLEELAKKS